MKDKKYIQSIERAAMVLDYIAGAGSAKLNEICNFTGLKTSTAFGIIQTLEHTGQVTRTCNGLEYTLGLSSLKYGLSYLDGSGVVDKIHILLQKLVEVVDETAYFEIQVGQRYYYLDCVVSSQPLKVVPDENKFIDLPENSAVAKVFNSNDSELRYATDMQEVDDGLNCFGIPFRTGGKIVACVAFTGPACRFTFERMEEAYRAYRVIMTELEMDSHL